MRKKNRLSVGGIALAALCFAASTSHGQDVKFDLPALGGGAVAPDGVRLVVSLTAKTELLYIDTVTGKEQKRTTLEFQPTQIAWGDKVLFVAQKGSGVVHVLDSDTGKEIGQAKGESPVRNLVVVKGICFASTSNRQLFAVDAKGALSKIEPKGTYIGADPKGEFIGAAVDGKATTDVGKLTIDGVKATQGKEFFRSLRESLINVQGLQVTPDGKAFGVVAAGGWADQERKRHFGIPLYSTEDMKSQVGDLETGPVPCGFIVNADPPLLFACSNKDGSTFNAKSFAPVQKFTAPKASAPGTQPSVLTFVAKGKKLAWGVSSGDTGVLKFYDLKEASK